MTINPTPTPPLVDVIAGVLAGDDPDWQDYRPDAHAVLDALTEAGSLEWAIEAWGEIFRVDSEHEARLQVDMQRASHVFARIKSGPWLEVKR